MLESMLDWNEIIALCIPKQVTGDNLFQSYVGYTLSVDPNFFLRTVVRPGLLIGDERSEEVQSARYVSIQFV